MKTLPVVVCSALMAACATPPADPYADLSDDELQARFTEAKKQQPLPYCDELVPITRAILRRESASEQTQTFNAYAAFQCALDEQRWGDAYDAMIAYEASSGRSMGSFGFRMAYFTEHYADAVARLEAIGPGNYSGEIFRIEPDVFWDLFFDVSSQVTLQQRALDAMLGSPYFQGLPVGFRSELAQWKLRMAASAGNFEGADPWIEAMLRPTFYLPMLADQSFEPIWPKLEQAVGEHFVTINERHVKAVSQAYQRDTSDREAYQRLAHALMFAGRFEQVAEFVKTPADDSFESLTHDEAWALNMKVEALDALGRTDQATALFERLATIPVNENNQGWLISFTINRAERLAGYGQWGKALDAIAYAEGFSGSDYARSIIRRVKVCALAGQGKDVSALLADVYRHRKDGYINAAMALVCAGERDRAAGLMMEVLNNDSERRHAVKALQDPRFSFYRVRPQTPNLHSLLESHPPLREAFSQHARLIPERYIPRAQLNSL